MRSEVSGRAMPAPRISARCPENPRWDPADSRPAIPVSPSVRAPASAGLVPALGFRPSAATGLAGRCKSGRPVETGLRGAGRSCLIVDPAECHARSLDRHGACIDTDAAARLGSARSLPGLERGETWLGKSRARLLGQGRQHPGKRDRAAAAATVVRGAAQHRGLAASLQAQVRHHLLPAVSNGPTNEQKPHQETSASLPLGPVPFMVVSELGSRPLPRATAVSISVAGHRQHTNTMHPAGNTGAGAPSHSAARAGRNSRSLSSVGACGVACSERAQAPRRHSPGKYNSTTESSPSRARFEADVASNCRRFAARPQGIAPGAVLEQASGAFQ